MIELDNIDKARPCCFKDEDAIFHGFFIGDTVDMGRQSFALIELPDGSVKNVFASQVRFADSEDMFARYYEEEE